MNKMSNMAGALAVLIVFSGVSFADPCPGIGLDRLSLRAVRSLHSAEVTYFALNFNGYGSLGALREAGLIDPVLATGNKYGHIFVVSLTPSTPTSPARYSVTATPRAYRKAGRWSFFIDESGQVRGADKRGEPATEADPIIITANCSSASAEGATIANLRTLISAEITYFALFGNYTGLARLAKAGLIDVVLASGQTDGYLIFVVTSTQPAGFRINAVPQTYGTTGIRSFFANENGVIRAADHQGGPANEKDPPI